MAFLTFNVRNEPHAARVAFGPGVIEAVWRRGERDEPARGERVGHQWLS
ncbi:hypothetical protein FRUB_09659 [Fimbriiglobus ruber]|uniref:Uncharacterized protein n=1 Tax=Fimbriiglobus ruber TaxID=1908690 RepID=A0A225DFF1_9BACT|nr:hypothetical protein FRUB_09659 [Fimbriiglobus ruber]